MTDLQLIFHALDFATRKHRPQRRKNVAADPYINHPIAVAHLLVQHGITDAKLIAAALLHDTVEDTATTQQELTTTFGADISAIVMEVSDDKSQPKAVRKQQQIDHAPHLSAEAKLVKLADKICNLYDVLYDPPCNWSVQRRQEYAAWTAQVVHRLGKCHVALEQYYAQLLHETQQQLNNTSNINTSS